MTPRRRVFVDVAVPAPSVAGVITYCGQADGAFTSANTVNAQNARYDVMEDYVIDRYHARSKAGEVFNNPMTRYRVEESFVHSGQYDQKRKIGCGSPPLLGTGSHQRTYGGAVYCKATRLRNESDQNLPNLSALAGTRAMAGISEPSVQGLVELAEAGKTIKMLLNPLENFYKLIRSLPRSKTFKRWAKSRKLKGLPSSLTDFLSSEWLRYRYGILPLFYLKDDLVKALAEASEKPKRMTSRGSSQHSWSDTRVTPRTSSSIWSNAEVIDVHTYDVKVRAGVLYEHTLQIDALQGKYGLRLNDIPEAAYELVPFSFVADWIYNFGEYLGAIRPKVGVKILSSWTVTTTLEEFSRLQVQQGGVGDSNYTVTDNRQAKSTVKVYSQQRTPGVTVAPVFRGWKTMDFESIHLKRAVDTVALINQLLRK